MRSTQNLLGSARVLIMHLSASMVIHYQSLREKDQENVRLCAPLVVPRIDVADLHLRARLMAFLHDHHYGD
jgi:hypothetical protein